MNVLGFLDDVLQATFLQDVGDLYRFAAVTAVDSALYVIKLSAPLRRGAGMSPISDEFEVEVDLLEYILGRYQRVGQRLRELLSEHTRRSAMTSIWASNLSISASIGSQSTESSLGIAEGILVREYSKRYQRRLAVGTL